MKVNITSFLANNTAELNSFLELIPSPIFLKDKDGNYINCNKAFESFVGKTKSELIGHNVYDLWDKDVADIYFNKDQELFSHPGVQVYESKVKKDNGEVIHVEFHKTTYYGESGSVAGFVGIIFDRTKEYKKADELKDALNEMDKISRYDKLTGVYNRHKLDDELEKAMSLSDRYGTKHGVLLIGLDDFKPINDSHGHHEGDRVLTEFASLVSRTIRVTDVFGRWGGDEFLVLVPEANQQGIVDLASNITKAVNSHDFKTKLPLTVSIGMSLSRRNDVITSVLKRADSAMYNSKFKGKNTFTLL